MKKDRLLPTISLTVICLVAALLLGLVNNVTAPVIAQRTADAKAAQRKVVMQDAEKFEKVDVPKDAELSDMVLEAYKATKGGETVGYVFDVSSNGFGGPISITVGVDKDLHFTGVRIGDNTETAGLGSKSTDPKFYKQYDGKSGDPALTVNASGENNIDGITAATITSKAVTKGAQAAWNAAKALVGKGE